MVTRNTFQLSPRQRRHAFTITIYMFRAFGVIVILWYLSHAFNQSFLALDDALAAIFKTLEASAIASQENFD